MQCSRIWRCLLLLGTVGMPASAITNPLLTVSANRHLEAPREAALTLSHDGQVFLEEKGQNEDEKPEDAISKAKKMMRIKAITVSSSLKDAHSSEVENSAVKKKEEQLHSAAPCNESSDSPRLASGASLLQDEEEHTQSPEVMPAHHEQLPLSADLTDGVESSDSQRIQAGLFRSAMFRRAEHAYARRERTGLGPSQTSSQIEHSLLHRAIIDLQQEMSVLMLVSITVLVILFAILFAILMSTFLKQAASSSATVVSNVRTKFRQKAGIQEHTNVAVLNFDFETRDEEKQRTYRWQWCTSKQIEQLGLITQAPTKAFQGYKRIDIPLTHRGVQETLLDSDVDFTVFDFRKHGEELLWRLIRTEAYFMIINDEPQSVTRIPTSQSMKSSPTSQSPRSSPTCKPGPTKILVMLETVRLRCVHGARILIQQKCDTTLFAPGLCLPGKEKAGGDSPVAAAKKMWKSIFKLSPNLATFVLDSVEDKEIAGYKGIHCVERSHIVDVQLHLFADDNTEAIHKIGLPDHADFVIWPDKKKQDNAKGTTSEGMKSFTWMSMEECKASTVPPIDSRVFAPGRQLELSMKDEAVSANELQQFLEEAGVDVESPTWQSFSKKHGASRLEALTKELSEGGSKITNTINGLHRCIDVTAVRLWSPDQKLMLVEKCYRSVGDEEVWYSQLPESRRQSKAGLKDTVKLICEEKLGLPSEHMTLSDDSAWEYFEYSEESRRYEGLHTKYQKTFVDVVLTKDAALWQTSKDASAGR